MRSSAFAARIGLIGSALVMQYADAAALKVQPSRPQQLAGLVTAILVILCLTVGVVCVCNCYALLCPENVRGKSRDILAAPGKSFGLGILAAIVITLYFALVSSLPKAVADWGFVTGLVVSAAMVLTGLCGVFHALGNRLLNSLASEKASYDLWRVTAGAILIMACNFFPIVGQIITAVAILCALGVSTHHILRRKPKPQAESTSQAKSPDAEPTSSLPTS